MRRSSARWLATLLLLHLLRATGAAQPEGGEERPAPELTPPRLLEAPEVTLPPEAAPLPPDAGVVLRLTIDVDGSVRDAVVEETLREDVDALVLEAARVMRFAPATRAGQPVPAQVLFRFAVTPPAEATPPDTADSDASAETDAGADAAAGTGSDATAQPGADAADGPTLDAETGLLDLGEDPGYGATARVARPEAGAATRITLRGEELSTVPGTFGEPLRVVATFPGVARTPFGLGFFFVRGASFDNTGFFVDGFPVPLLYHLGAGPAVISSRLVDELDFYPGGYPVRYGRFSAGVIALETGAPEVESTHLEAEVDLLRASALAVVPFEGGRGTLTAAYRRSYYELILPLIVDGVDLAYQDWQARLDYALTDRLSFSLFWFGSEDSLDITQAAGAGVTDESNSTGLNYGFQRLIGKLVLRLPDQVKLTWSGTLGADETLVRRTEPGGIDLRAEIDGTYLGQRLEAILPAGEHFRTTAGIDVLATLYDARTTFPTPPGLGQFPRPLLDADLSELNTQPLVASAAPYLEQTFRFDPIEVAAGLRLEYLRYASVSTVELDPRGVVRLEAIEDALTVKAATGLFTQPPQPFQISPEFGNPRLEPQRAWQSSAGVEIELPESVEIESQLFYSRMFSLPRTVNAFVVEDGETRRQVFLADGEGRSYGWELLVRRRVEEGLYGWLSYTLSFSERFTGDGDTIPFFFDQRHVLNLLLSYAVDGWRFGARFTLSSGRPDRPVLGAEVDTDADRYAAVRGGLTARLPAYHQLDLRIDREFTLGALEGTVYLDVLNVYNAANAEGRLWQFDFQRSMDLPGIPVIGTIGVRLEYE